MKLRLSILAMSFAALIATPGAPASSRGDFYLSLGDSLAQGYQPIGGPLKSGNAPPGYNHGYADELFKLTRERYEQLQEVKLGCGGETTTTLRFGGGFYSYEQGSQLDAAAAFLEEHGGERSPSSRSTSAGTTCWVAGVGDRRKPPGNRRHAAGCGRAERADRRDELLRPIRRARLVRNAKPRCPRVGGREHRRVQRLPRGHLRHISASRWPTSSAFSLTDVTIQPSELPLNVQRACEWTWMCSIGDIHANSEGYAVIARAFAEGSRHDTRAGARLWGAVRIAPKTGLDLARRRPARLPVARCVEDGVERARRRGIRRAES